MNASPWYIEFFEDGFYHRRWAPAARFQRAEREVDFIVEALGLPSGAAVLDLCCGEGRHAVALARRGYSVTGLDLSAYQLRVARRTARQAGVAVRWRRADMRDIPWRGPFDAVINILTSFGYLESDEEDFRVLEAVSRALKPGGKFLIDTINREMLVRRWEARTWQDEADGSLRLEDRSFDLLSGRQRNRVLLLGPDGVRQRKEINLRNYTLTELVKMLSRAGMALRQVWGGFDGQEYGLDSPRMIVLAEKEGIA